ncbi:MAG: short-chain dehydrogenase/reductase [Verrucomicrobiales bacterium]|nr:short-chain dehydrogenase/reductase [Verrucomicrobiales bacterium]
MRLKGKVIIVIGGTTGIGLSAAMAFIREGASVLIVGRTPQTMAKAKQTLGSGARSLIGDASDSGTAATAIEKAVAEFGKVDGIYHVAGGSGRKHGDGPLHEISNEGWDYTLNLNLTSLFYSNRAAVRHFLKQGTGGAVLNISSVLSFSPSPHFFSTHAYAAAKAAVIGLTKSSAAFYAAKNIRFNLLLPALVETPMAERAISNSEIMKFIHTKQPLDGGRAGLPGDLDGAATFFMSDESCFVTGQVLAVDGGWSVTEGQIPSAT